jgi:hypothetical protein
MTTIKIAATAATSKQVCAPSRELNADELALVTGGTPSAKPTATPKEFLTFTFKLVTV